MVIGGAATLAVGAVWTRLFGVLWRLDRFPGVLPEDYDRERR